MSDPRYTDPRLDPRPFEENDIRERRMAELKGANAMWGWIAGAVVLALVLVFIFARGQSVETASNSVPPPAATNGLSPPQAPAPPLATPKAPPTTTGQGTAQ